jgi:hypothetical protein
MRGLAPRSAGSGTAFCESTDKSVCATLGLPIASSRQNGRIDGTDTLVCAGARECCADTQAVPYPKGYGNGGDVEVVVVVVGLVVTGGTSGTAGASVLVVGFAGGLVTGGGGADSAGFDDSVSYRF